jgi:hypothetical protein
MRELLREAQTGHDLHRPNISHNYRSNVIETLRWFCSELIYSDLERSLVELFTTASSCRLLELNLRSYDSESPQDVQSEFQESASSTADTGTSSVSEHPGSPYTIVQFDFSGISCDGVAWAARVHLAVRSSSDDLWRTVLHDISLTSPGRDGELVPYADLINAGGGFSDDLGMEIGLEVVVREFAQEMKNSLSAITTSVGLIGTDRGVEGSSDKVEMLGVIEENAARMNLMLSNFVQASRCPDLSRTRQDLTGMIAELAHELDEMGDGPRVILSPSSQSIPAEVDEGLMSQVFRFVTIAIPGYLRECSEIPVSCFRTGNTAYLRLEYICKDAGPDILRKVVLPFNSARDGGSGLDTKPIHTIVRAHGGKTFMQFTEDRMVMTIALPVTDSKRDMSK